MACAICQTRRPRRFCPGVGGDICTLCCGAGREVTIACPLDCEHLIDAHEHEKLLPVDPETLPNRDIDVSDDRVEENQALVLFLAGALTRLTVEDRELIDFDAREGLEASIRTHRTLQSGLLYESLPANPRAAAVTLALEKAIEEFRRVEAEKLGLHHTRESAVLSMLAFLQQTELATNNGRRRGRAFLRRIVGLYSEASTLEPSEPSSLLLP